MLFPKRQRLEESQRPQETTRIDGPMEGQTAPKLKNHEEAS